MNEFDIDNTFRMKLYNWRMANNLTQREAAVSLGCQQSQIWKWETGKNIPYKSTLERILPIIEAVPAPEREPVEEPWVPEPVKPKRPLTFCERMEQKYGSMEAYYAKTRGGAEPEEEVAEGFEPEAESTAEHKVEVIAELPLTPPTKPTPSLVKLTEVIGFLKCLALYAAEGVAEPLEQQIKTLQDIAEEMSA